MRWFSLRALTKMQLDADDRAAFKAHMEQCERDKEAIRTEIREGLREHREERRLMHEENKESLGSLMSSVRKLQVVYYFASALIAIMGFLSTDWGSNILIKLGLVQLQ